MSTALKTKKKRSQKPRREVVAEVMGKYAWVATSSRAFAARKREEVTREAGRK